MKKIIISTICCVLCFIILSINGIIVNKVFAEDNLQIDAKSSLLIDVNSGTILHENHAEDKLQVASIVKLMTTLITMEKIEKGEFKLEDKLTTTENSSSMGGSQAFIEPYCEYTISDMLKSVIISSANDSSVALAEYISGSESEFVKLMNNRAKELGLNNTHYVNCTGLGEPSQYSTAKDVATLLTEVMKHDIYHKYSTIWIDEITHQSGRKTELVNTNKLIRYFKNCDSGKTGSTDEAGFCLSASAKRNDMRLIAVVLGAKTSDERFNQTSKLLNHGFANFENKKIVDCKDVIQEIPVIKSSTKFAKIVADKDFYLITKKGTNKTIDKNIEIQEKVVAPTNNNQIVGKLILSQNGIVIKEINLVIKEEISSYTLKEGLKEISSNWKISKAK